jgi:hypothetical protein
MSSLAQAVVMLGIGASAFALALLATSLLLRGFFFLLHAAGERPRHT